MRKKEIVTGDAEPPCPLHNGADNHANRYNPKTREAALCYQLHDTLRAAFGLAHVSPESFEAQGLRMIEAHINAYRAMRDGTFGR